MEPTLEGQAPCDEEEGIDGEARDCERFKETRRTFAAEQDQKRVREAYHAQIKSTSDARG